MGVWIPLDSGFLYLIGVTPIGRITVELLKINDPFRVELREELIAEGLFPPA